MFLELAASLLLTQGGTKYSPRMTSGRWPGPGMRTLSANLDPHVRKGSLSYCLGNAYRHVGIAAIRLRGRISGARWKGAGARKEQNP